MMEFSTHAITSEWLVQQVISAVIHSAIYGMAYHLFKGLSLNDALFAGCALLLGVWMISRLCKP